MKKQPPAARRYPASLAKPMVPPTLHYPGLLFATLTPEQEAQNKVAWNEWGQEVYRRMEVLRGFHGVPEGAWLMLAVILAREVVPGLRVAAAPGRPKEWDPLKIARLRFEMDKLIQERGPSFTIESAAKAMAKRAEWKPAKPSRSATKPWEALRRKYYAADPRWLKMVQDADAWDALVKETIDTIPSQDEKGS